MMEAPISARRLSELVGYIYDAAIDPDAWPIAMDAIRRELHFHNAVLGLNELPSGRVLMNVTCNVPPAFIPLIDVAGADVVEQWGGMEVVASLPLDRPAVMSHVNPRLEAIKATNHYFRVFAEPQGLVDVMVVGLARNARAVGSLAFGRHHQAGPIDEGELAVAALLVPHLQRAATVNRMLDIAAVAHASFAAALDALAVPIALVTRDRRVVHANATMRTLFGQGDPLRLSRGVLETRQAGVASALAIAIAQAADDEARLARQGLGIPLHTDAGTPGALHVLPIRPGRGGMDDKAIAAVFVASADTPFVPPTDIIRSLFDLTIAEARVFERIVGGHTVARTASDLGIAHSTAKTHLLRIYNKLGVNRQSSLIHIAASLRSGFTDRGQEMTAAAGTTVRKKAVGDRP